MRIAVVGGGIAGVSAAFALATSGAEPDVVLIEAEQELAAHTTGRSAAQYIKNYGVDTVKALTLASYEFLANPPSSLADHSHLSPRGQLTVADAAQEDYFQQLLVDGQHYDDTIAEIDIAEACRLFPPLRPGRFTRAMVEPNSADIDVAGLHQTFVRGFRAAGGEIRTNYRLDAATRAGSGWSVETTSGIVEADVIVNAAGAWGDVVARRAGVAPIGLQPMRRTAFMVGHDHPEMGQWPLVASVEHSWYLKPDGPQLLCSPANEDPMEPCDVKAEELDVALAIERINDATTLGIRSVRSSWAGLRTFTSDRSMVVGADDAEPSFIWCVGQGGTGIQTAPAVGRLVADLVGDGAPGAWCGDVGLDPSSLGVARLRRSDNPA